MTVRDALCILSLVATGCISESDAVLLRRFPGARADLERVLADLPRAAPSVRVASSWSNPSLPAEQLLRVRRALEHAGIVEGVLKRGGAFLFIVEAYGMIHRGWAKGFAYLPGGAEPASLRTSLDDPRSLPHGLFVRPIPGAPDWYIFVDR